MRIERSSLGGNAAFGAKEGTGGENEETGFNRGAFHGPSVMETARDAMRIRSRPENQLRGEIRGRHDGQARFAHFANQF
jgi:hypothetical protein